jgi:hypothetical protein
VAFSYTSLQTKVMKAVNKLGRDTTFAMKSESPADSNKPWRGPADASDTTLGPAKAVFSSFMDEAIDGTIIRRSDKDVIVAYTALGADLRNIDTIIDPMDGQEYGVLSVNIVAPGPSIIIYQMHCRR